MRDNVFLLHTTRNEKGNLKFCKSLFSAKQHIDNRCRKPTHLAKQIRKVLRVPGIQVAAVVVSQSYVTSHKTNSVVPTLHRLMSELNRGLALLAAQSPETLDPALEPW